MWGRTVSAEHVYAINTTGLQVYYLPNIVQGVEDLLSGVADIVFVRADLLENLQAQGTLTVSSFKVLAQVI